MEHEPTPLPAMPAWHARSFWLMVAAAVSSLSVMTGFDIFAFFGAENEEGFTDLVMPLVAMGTTVWMWLERKNPARSLSITGRNDA